jgi:hypothetical protein
MFVILLYSIFHENLQVNYQVLIHLAKQFQRRFLEIDQSETRIACGSHVCKRIRDDMTNINRGLSIDASYQVHL